MLAKTHINIRKARIEEASTLSDLSLRSKQSNGYDKTFMALCYDELTVTPSQLIDYECWVAVTDSICGYVCLIPDVSLKTGEIQALFVDPNQKRRGIGQILWAKVIERARFHAIRTLVLDADPLAVPFYEAMGLKITGETPSASILGRFLPQMSIMI